MSEARWKQNRNKQILSGYPLCIYCGTAGASTIDHCPPKMMFPRKERLPGFEIPSCADCNSGSSHADLIASFFCRAEIGKNDEYDSKDTDKIMKSLRNNLPGFFEDATTLSRAAEKRKLAEAGLPRDHGLIRVDGPITSENMLAFSLKLTIAMHFEATKKSIPASARFTTRWFSNYENATGTFPKEAFDNFPPMKTLVQGRKSSHGFFEWTSQCTEDGDIGVHLGVFRTSFAVIGLMAFDEATFQSNGHDPDRKLFSTNDLGRILKSLKQ